MKNFVFDQAPIDYLYLHSEMYQNWEKIAFGDNKGQKTIIKQ